MSKGNNSMYKLNWIVPGNFHVLKKKKKDDSNIQKKGLGSQRFCTVGRVWETNLILFLASIKQQYTERNVPPL